ncbi:hypothetical protein TRFO_41552 [Tritrichomonas foetus]|uniref:Uncharacterized protein n=1 Tax=Tritrichomonas foetus TaxID=1144522 RepID=A0A1J4L4C6_9EUKA|nr:hypothetical protein TRFO_41552 [Tritrichomonas foetus]|eukprot:OHT16781.1 hypothetical protein TRFO_41552 [Tritrichomonas foetus]
MNVVEVAIKSIDNVSIQSDDPIKIFFIIQNSERYTVQKSNYYDLSDSIPIDELFTITSRNHLVDAVIISFFFKTESVKYNPIGTVRYLVNDLKQAKEVSGNLPIFTFAGEENDSNGSINVTFTYANLGSEDTESETLEPIKGLIGRFNDGEEMNVEEELSKLNLSPGLVRILVKFVFKAKSRSNKRPEASENDNNESEYSEYSDSFSDFDDLPFRRRKRKRAPAAFHAYSGQGRRIDGVDENAFKFKSKTKKAKAYKRRKAILKESGDGMTTGAMAIHQRNKSLNATLKNLNIDPEKLKIFADFKAILEKNNEVLDKAKTESKGMENGIIRAPLTTVTLRTLGYCIESTEQLIEQIKSGKFAKETAPEAPPQTPTQPQHRHRRAMSISKK